MYNKAVMQKKCLLTEEAIDEVSGVALARIFRRKGDGGGGGGFDKESTKNPNKQLVFSARRGGGKFPTLATRLNSK